MLVENKRMEIDKTTHFDGRALKKSSRVFIYAICEFSVSLLVNICHTWKCERIVSFYFLSAFRRVISICLSCVAWYYTSFQMIKQKQKCCSCRCLLSLHHFTFHFVCAWVSVCAHTIYVCARMRWNERYLCTGPTVIEKQKPPLHI